MFNRTILEQFTEIITLIPRVYLIRRVRVRNELHFTPDANLNSLRAGFKSLICGEETPGKSIIFPPVLPDQHQPPARVLINVDRGDCFAVM